MVGQVGLRSGQTQRGVVAVGMVLLIGFAGCAGERPQAAPSITQDQVRDHAKQGFDKLSQEEKNRAGSSVGDPLH